MPRQSTGPRLWFDKARNRFTIIDRDLRMRTGFGREDADQAEQALRNYIAGKHEPAKSPDPLIADVLNVYMREQLPDMISSRATLSNIRALLPWWGRKRVSEITNSSCKAYAREKRHDGIVRPKAARRDLEILRAAVRYWNGSDHGPLRHVPIFTLPDKEDPRERWLTRKECARLLWAARRKPHLARFILLGWYTGSRAGVLQDLQWSQIDFNNGVLYRKRRGAKKADNKRAPPVKLGKRLLGHLRRWHNLDGADRLWVCHRRGQKFATLYPTWYATRKVAKLDDEVIPHSLRHSRATHLAKAGVASWEAAQSLGMTVIQYDRTYAHHRPEWQSNAAEVR